MDPSNRLYAHEEPPPNPFVQEEMAVQTSPEFDDARNSDSAIPKRKRCGGVSSESEETSESSEEEREIDEVRLKIVQGECPITTMPQKWFNEDMFELFSVIIDDDEQHHLKDHLCGSIEMVGGFGFVELFERENPEEDMTSVFKNKDGLWELLLTGPTVKNFIANDPVGVRINIRNAKTNKSFHPGFVFNGNSIDTNPVYNTPLSAIISGKGFGSITVNYAVFDKSVAAKVEVTTTNGHDDVFGEIYAQNSVYKIKTCLFYKKQQKKPEECIVSAHPQQHMIPLSKSILSVPIVGNLRIDLDLKDSNTGLSIVKDAFADFTVPPDLRNIKVWNGIRVAQKIGNDIEVAVIWSLLYMY